MPSKFGGIPIEEPTASKFGGVPLEKAAAAEINAVNQDIGPLESFAIGAGRGMTTIGRALGLAQPEDPMVTASFQGLKQQNPISTGLGEVAGESAPFLIPGGMVSSIASAPFRIGAAGAMGALEGGLITAGQGGNAGEVISNAGISSALGSGLEMGVPYVGRFLGSLVRRVTGSSPKGPLFDQLGNPSADLQAAMSKVGMTMEDLADYSGVRAGTSPEELLRKTRFESIGMPATKGDISQNFAQQAQEQRVASMATGQSGEPLRQLQLKQSERFVSGINEMVDSFGVSDDLGTQVKEALTGRYSKLSEKKNKLYKDFAEQSGKANEMPIFTDNIMKALPDKAEMRRIRIQNESGMNAVNDLLVEFGIDQSEDAVEKFIKSGGEITPLNIGNFETFRQAMNQLVDNTTPGGRRVSYVIKNINEALDNEVDAVHTALMDASAQKGVGLDELREARSIVSGMKKEFSPDALVGKLIATKADGVTPLVEASKVYDSVMGKSKPIEYLQRTLDSLNKSPRGKQAIGAMQAETVMRALDSAMKAPSRKTSGIQTVGYSQFVKELERVGQDKLDVLFANNKDGLKKLMTYKEVASDLTPDARAMPKGSAPVLMDLMNRLGSQPGIAQVVEPIRYIIRAGADDRAVRRALDNRPEVKRQMKYIANGYPSLAAALGISYLNQEEVK